MFLLVHAHLAEAALRFFQSPGIVEGLATVGLPAGWIA